MEPKINIVLNMIVKDEAHVIKETLQSVYDIFQLEENSHVNFSGYAINDTGSSDGSQKVIRDFFTERNINGVIINHEFRSCKCHPKRSKRYYFFHFGWNRTFAFDMCQNKINTGEVQKIKNIEYTPDGETSKCEILCDYIWVIDADDLVHGSLIFPKVMNKDMYGLVYNKGNTYGRPQIFKCNKNLQWKYKDAIHEYAISKKKNNSKDTIKGDYFIESRRLGSRSIDPEKYLKDAKICEYLINEKPNKPHARRWYYGANSYYDFGDMDNALRMYKKRVTLEDYDEEVFNSYMRIADIYKTKSVEWDKIEEIYHKASTSCIRRKPEAMYEIAWQYAYVLNDNKIAYNYLKNISTTPYPEGGLFIRNDLYHWRIKDDLSIMCLRLGKFKEGFYLCSDIINSPHIDKQNLQRVTKNMNVIHNNLKVSEKKICVLYTGNEIIEQKSLLNTIASYLLKNFQLIIVGNKVNTYVYQNVIVITTTDFMDMKLKIDYMIIYDSINYLLDCHSMYKSINPNHIIDQLILIQSNGAFTIKSTNDTKIAIINYNYLQPLIKYINKIVCLSERAKNNLIETYNLENVEYIDANSSLNYFLLFDDVKYEYNIDNMSKQIEGQTNGVIYFRTQAISHMENLVASDFNKQCLIKYYEGIVNDYPKMPEHQYILGDIHLSFDNIDKANQIFNTAVSLCESSDKKYLDTIKVKIAEVLHKQKKYKQSYQLANEILKRSNITESFREHTEKVQDVNIQYLQSSFDGYNKNQIDNIVNQLSKKNSKKIMLSITSCKRFDLFQRTINSFIESCTDCHLIDYWLCVDDNSSDKDRKNMQDKYPFFNYIFKNENEKGHVSSMNMIRDKAIELNVDYIFHMEDDFHFIQHRNYITDCLDIMNEKNDQLKIGQVLVNNLYGEEEPYKRGWCKGGILKHTKNNQRYFVHEHYVPGTKEHNEFMERIKKASNHAYWPHFSFRPSLVNVDMLKDIGPYYNTIHFERAYANEYNAHNYVSCFLDTFSCIHIGKKTWESGNNSYSLNKINQFGINASDLLIYVLSSGNKDIWKTFKNNAYDKLHYMIRYNKPNITWLSDFDKKWFHNNTFNYDRDVMNNIKFKIEPIFECVTNKAKHVMILHETVQLSSNTQKLIKLMMKECNRVNYDVIILDKHKENNSNKIRFIQTQIKLDNFDEYFGYLVSNSGAQKIIDYLEVNRIKNINYLSELNLKVCILNMPLYNVNNDQFNEIIYDKSKYPEIDGYTFYSQLDSYGGDIGLYDDADINKLAKICNEIEGEAFNTYGYIKKVVDVKLSYLSVRENHTFDGIYIKNK